LASQELCSVK